MPDRTIQVKVFRFDPSTDKEPHYQTYPVPFESGMSAMTALDYIYQNLDGTLSYYDHAACDLGICMRCLGRINGRTALFCQSRIEENVTLAPPANTKVLKDLVTWKTSDKEE